MSETGFDKQIGKTLEFEGGYVDDEDDPGGETNFGISKRSYPDLDIRSLTRADAIAIYRRDYWKNIGLAQLSDPIGGKVFDLGVNMGPRTAVKLLQRAVNRLQPFEHLDIDGHFGGLTKAAANAHPDEQLLQALRSEASNHYLDIARAHPGMNKFIKGWLRRANA